MARLISKEDVVKYTRLRPSIPESEIQLDIDNAIDNEFTPRVPAAFLTDLETVVARKTSVWNRTKTYAVDTYITHNNRQYVCIQEATNKVPDVETAYWTEVVMYTLFHKYIRPALAKMAYSFFLGEHGINVTQFGVSELEDGTGTPIAEATRARLIRDYHSQSNAMFNALKKELSDASYVVDGTTYTWDSDTVESNGSNTKFKVI